MIVDVTPVKRAIRPNDESIGVVHLRVAQATRAITNQRFNLLPTGNQGKTKNKKFHLERLPLFHSVCNPQSAATSKATGGMTMTRRLIAITLLTSGLMLAQFGGGYRSSDPYGRSWGPTQQWRSDNRLIDSIQNDISRIGQRSAWDGWAVKQFSQAVENLERFQLEAARGKFDRGRLDRAIDNLNRLLTAPELHPRDKQRIAFHRDELRYFRARNS
jgi:hypothetical protein